MAARDSTTQTKGQDAPVLVTGGTAAARTLAERIAAAGFPVIYALAGATPRPNLPRHPNIAVHTGGFGGAAGLAHWLRRRGIAAVVDATHPHARNMPHHALRAARKAGVPHVRLLPPPPPLPAAADIVPLADIARMAELLPRHARAFAALGSRGLSALASRADVWLIARMISPPAFFVPPRWRLIVGARGAPRMTVAAELALLKTSRAQVLLARHAEGSRNMVHAAAHLRLPVLLLARPAPPAGARVLASMGEVLDWLRRAGR